MSMHIYEDIVEGAVRVLSKHDGGDDVRDLIATLYRFQSQYDCKFTQGRVLAELVASGYAYAVPVSAHPAYADHRAAFDKAVKDAKEVTLGSEITGSAEGLDDEEVANLLGSEEGYITGGKLYCDVGTPLWNELVKRKVLKGADAKPLKNVPFFEVGVRVIDAATKAKDDELAALVYALGPDTFFDEPTAADLAATPAVVALRDRIRSIKLPKALRDDLVPPPQYRSESQAWWFAE